MHPIHINFLPVLSNKTLFKMAEEILSGYESPQSDLKRQKLL